MVLVDESIGRSGKNWGNDSLLMPKSAASFCNSQFWFRPHVKHSLGCLESINSIMERRTSTISGSCVIISMFSSTGVQHARTILLLLLRRTIHMPHDAVGGKSGCLHSVGIFI
jgi:hypothetical protein